MKAELETLRRAYVAHIDAKLEPGTIRHAEALAVCADLFAARNAYSELLAGTISSYSIAGRSVSKRDPAALRDHIDSLTERLADLIGDPSIITDPDRPRTAEMDYSRL